MDLETIEPFVTVQKDGFMMIGCVKDAMYVHGDKHGNNKFDYKMGDTANVSIVHYKDKVPKEDRKPTTHAQCFEFCRTVPDMLFFGINNGNDCYCTPFYKPMASDSSECDSVCDGDNTLMCGGSKKSSIFEMHSCDDTEANLETAQGNLEDALGSLTEALDTMKGAAETGEADANTVQDSMGSAGDPDASALCQEAKIYAGELVHLGEDAQELVDAATEKKDESKDLAGKDFKKMENAKKAEKATKEMNEATTEATEMAEKVQGALDDSHPPEDEDDIGRADEYVGVMTYADPDMVAYPSTCTGDMLQIVFGKDEDHCAAKCDDMIGKGCQAFQYFGEGDGLCFLFKNVIKAQYWTGCDKEEGKAGKDGGDKDGGKDGGKKFMQLDKKSQGAAPFRAQCLVKASNYMGIDLNPDKSGKNDFALKELTKANRCFE